MSFEDDPVVDRERKPFEPDGWKRGYWSSSGTLYCISCFGPPVPEGERIFLSGSVGEVFCPKHSPASAS